MEYFGESIMKHSRVNTWESLKRAEELIVDEIINTIKGHALSEEKFRNHYPLIEIEDVATEYLEWARHPDNRFYMSMNNPLVKQRLVIIGNVPKTITLDMLFDQLNAGDHKPTLIVTSDKRLSNYLVLAVETQGSLGVGYAIIHAWLKVRRTPTPNPQSEL